MLKIRKPGHRRIRQAPSEKTRRLDHNIDALTREFIDCGAIDSSQNSRSNGTSRLLERAGADNLHRRQHRKFGQLLLIGAGSGEYHRRKPTFLVGFERRKQIG